MPGDEDGADDVPCGPLKLCAVRVDECEHGDGAECACGDDGVFDASVCGFVGCVCAADEVCGDDCEDAGADEGDVRGRVFVCGEECV